MDDFESHYTLSMQAQFFMREQFHNAGTLHGVDIIFLKYEPYFIPEQLADILLMTAQEKLDIVLNTNHVLIVDNHCFVNQLGAYEIITAYKTRLATELRDWLGQILYRVWRKYQLHLKDKASNKKQ